MVVETLDAAVAWAAVFALYVAVRLAVVAVCVVLSRGEFGADTNGVSLTDHFGVSWINKCGDKREGDCRTQQYGINDGADWCKGASKKRQRE